MMDLSNWAFKNRLLVYFVLAVLVVGGGYSCYEMSKLEDPEVKVKAALVVATYPGASAHQVEMELTDVLEKHIRTMDAVDQITSYSYNDLSILQVELKPTVPDAQVEQYWDMLRRRVGDTPLPPGANRPIVKDDFGQVFGMFYALTGDGMGDRQLADYAELIKRELLLVKGVERIDLYGERSECIYINLLQDRMANLGVSPAEVLATLNGQNQTTYSGYFDNGDRRVRIHVSDRFRTVDDIGQMLIQGHDQDQLRLRDIALIEKAYAEPTRAELIYDGERAIGILIAASSQEDILKVGAAVEEKLAQLQADRLPAGVEYHRVFYQPQRVGNALQTFVVNLIESVAIVVIILMLAMGFKSGYIIGLTLVFTVLGSFLFLQALDGTMQRVSLGTFILAMGMLVDNAIVIIDGILVDLKAGKPRMEALTAIGRQTAMPLLGATLIAIIAFLPIFLSPDTAGAYTRDLFIVLAVSLMLSWVLALLYVPLVANRKLFPQVESAAAGGTAYQGWAYRWLRLTLGFGLQHRWTFVGGMVGLLLLALVGFRYMRQGFFPDMEYDQLYMEYKLPESTHSKRVKRDLQEIESYLRQNPEVTRVTASIGSAPGRYNLVRYIPLPSLSYGELIVDFTSPQALVEQIDSLQAYLTAHYPDAYVKLKRYNLMFRQYPIEAQFMGPDPAVLHQLADSTRRLMEQTPEVTLITTDWEPKVPVLNVEYDQAAARALGLSRSDVSLSLLTAAGGIPIGEFYEGIHANAIYVRCLDDNGRPIEDLESTQVFSTLPSPVGLLNEETMLRLRSGSITKDELIRTVLSTTPLKQICRRVELQWEDPVVPRIHGQRCQRVQCSPAAGISTEKARQAIASRLDRWQLPTGYSFRWGGEYDASTRSKENLFKFFPASVILMIVILIMLFKDYRKPLIIFCSIPMVLVGVVAVMLLTGKTFDFVAIVGTLGLIGMLVKNGIVLMDEINLQIQQGVEPSLALMESAQSRLRPVMMASLTTILGMIPLLSDAMFGSMAAAIMGGLLFGTLITLLFIPVLYAMFFRVKS